MIWRLELRKRVAVSAIAFAFLASPAPTRAGDGFWAGASPFVGVQLLDPHLEDFGWDVTPALVMGAEVRGGRGRFALGLRGWRSGTQQAVGLEGEPDLGVALSALELDARVDALRRGRWALVGTTSLGRLRAGYDREQLEIPGTGGPPLVVTFEPLSSWTLGLGAAVRGDLSEQVALGLQVQRWWFDLETAHRAGDQIELMQERFGQWALRLSLDWRWIAP